MTDKAFALARLELGVKEITGAKHNPVVVQYFEDAGHAWVTDDETAWCAAFVGAMLRRSGLPSTGELTARSYLKWGEAVDLDKARPGDLVLFSRGTSSWQGHVGFYVSHDKTHITVLGGNQSNAVTEARYGRASLLGIRRMDDPTAPKQPASRAPARSGWDWSGLFRAIFTRLGRRS